MSTMADTRAKKVRRSFTEEFKAGAVRLVLDEGKSVGAAARDLDLRNRRCAIGSSALGLIAGKANRVC